MAAEDQPKYVPPRHGRTPGMRGYKKGCRCATCRKANTEKSQKYRAGKREAAEAVAAQPTTEPGTIEAVVRAELLELVGEPPWKNSLVELALANARLIDRIPGMGAWQLMSTTQGRLLDVLDRLRKAAGTGAPGPMNELEAFVNGLQRPS